MCSSNLALACSFNAYAYDSDAKIRQIQLLHSWFRANWWSPHLAHFQSPSQKSCRRQNRDVGSFRQLQLLSSCPIFFQIPHWVGGGLSSRSRSRRRLSFLLKSMPLLIERHQRSHLSPQYFMVRPDQTNIAQESTIRMDLQACECRILYKYL